jgi:type II secretory pathway pseudopilin PulG
MKNNLPKIYKYYTGYTIIETMIAVSIFLIIVMVGMDSLLNAGLIHQQSQDVRSLLDSLTYTMEDMSRNLRTGSNYSCLAAGDTISAFSAPAPKSGQKCWAIEFEPAKGNPLMADQWIYKIESQDSGTTFNISKSVDGGTSWVQLNPAGVLINSISGFSVLGAETSKSGDKQQPLVIIRLVGKITTKSVDTPFYLQTSVSQRLLDS